MCEIKLLTKYKGKFKTRSQKKCSLDFLQQQQVTQCNQGTCHKKQLRNSWTCIIGFCNKTDIRFLPFHLTWQYNSTFWIRIQKVGSKKKRRSTYSNLIFPPERNSLWNSQRKNTSRLMEKNKKLGEVFYETKQICQPGRNPFHHTDICFLVWYFTAQTY